MSSTKTLRRPDRRSRAPRRPSSTRIPYNARSKGIVVSEVRDEEELSKLLEMMRLELRAIAASRIPSFLRRLVDPDDVLQEAFISARRRFPFFESTGPGSLEGWLRKIVQNKTLQMIRDQLRTKRDRKRTLTPSALEQPADSTVRDLLEAIGSKEQTPSVHARAHELFQAILVTWELLSEQQKGAVMLRHFKKKSLEECSRLLGITEGAVRGHCHRGLKVLREALKDFR